MEALKEKATTRSPAASIMLPMGIWGVAGERPLVQVRCRKDIKRMLQLVHERPALESIAAVLRTDPTACFIDVGAAAGAYTLLAASILNNDGTVVAIEPDVESRIALESNIGLGSFEPHLTVLPCALSNFDGPSVLYTDGLNAQAPSLHHDPRISGSMPIEVRRLDTILPRLVKPSQNIVIKIDVEGAESLVIAGMAEILAGSRVTNMLVEHHPDFMTAPFGCTSEDLHWELVEGYGFGFHQIMRRRDIRLTHYMR